LLMMMLLMLLMLMCALIIGASIVFVRVDDVVMEDYGE